MKRIRRLGGRKEYLVVVCDDISDGEVTGRSGRPLNHANQKLENETAANFSSRKMGPKIIKQEKSKCFRIMIPFHKSHIPVIHIRH